MRRSTGILALLLLTATNVFAETAYITDNLRLRMYANADLTGERVDTLESGQQFEVLSRNSQTAFIELPDGRQGYVSAAYIVYEKPAKLVVAESQGEVDRLTQELQTLRDSFAEPAAVIDSLQQQNADIQSQLDGNAARMTELESVNASLVSRAESYAHSLPYTWVGGAIAVCLLGGFLLGLWWTDRQSRKRHGGIRIY